jgi:hypothetical protein
MAWTQKSKWEERKQQKYYLIHPCKSEFMNAKLSEWKPIAQIQIAFFHILIWIEYGFKYSWMWIQGNKFEFKSAFQYLLRLVDVSIHLLVLSGTKSTHNVLVKMKYEYITHLTKSSFI